MTTTTQTPAEAAYRAISTELEGYLTDFFLAAINHDNGLTTVYMEAIGNEIEVEGAVEFLTDQSPGIPAAFESAAVQTAFARLEESGLFSSAILVAPQSADLNENIPSVISMGSCFANRRLLRRFVQECNVRLSMDVSYEYAKELM